MFSTTLEGNTQLTSVISFIFSDVPLIFFSTPCIMNHDPIKCVVMVPWRSRFDHTIAIFVVLYLVMCYEKLGETGDGIFLANITTTTTDLGSGHL